MSDTPKDEQDYSALSRGPFALLDIEKYTRQNTPVPYPHLTVESLRDSTRSEVICAAMGDVRALESTANVVRVAQVVEHRIALWELAHKQSSDTPRPRRGLTRNSLSPEHK